MGSSGCRRIITAPHAKDSAMPRPSRSPPRLPRPKEPDTMITVPVIVTAMVIQVRARSRSLNSSQAPSAVR
jgi:hypothetical protein